MFMDMRTQKNQRLFDQANTLAELLDHDTVYLAGSQVLGVGAQTRVLAQRSPEADFTSADVFSKA